MSIAGKLFCVPINTAQQALRVDRLPSHYLHCGRCPPATQGQRTDMLNELRPLTFCRDDAMYGIRVCIWSDSVHADPNDAGNVS